MEVIGIIALKAYLEGGKHCQERHGENDAVKQGTNGKKITLKIINRNMNN